MHNMWSESTMPLFLMCGISTAAHGFKGENKNNNSTIEQKCFLYVVNKVTISDSKINLNLHPRGISRW